MVKTKKQDDTGQHRAAAREVEERMKTHANRNADEPPRLVRRARAQAWSSKVLPYCGGVGAWDIRGGNIELFATSPGIY